MGKLKELHFERVRAADAARYAAELTPILHSDDREEMQLLGADTEAYIAETIRSSTECMAVRSAEGELLNMMGLCNSFLAGWGVPVWSLKAEGEKHYKREFVVYGLQTIRHFLDKEPRLFNFISGENKSSLRFICRAGAKLLGAVPYGARGRMFIPFILTKEAFEDVWRSSVHYDDHDRLDRCGTGQRTEKAG